MSKFNKDFDNIKCESLLKRLHPNLQCWPQWGRSASKPSWIRKRRNPPLFPSPVQKPLRLNPENWSQQMDVAKRICWGLLPQRIERNVGAAHRDMTAELCKLSIWQLLNSRFKSRGRATITSLTSCSSSLAENDSLLPTPSHNRRSPCRRAGRAETEEW